MSTRLACLNSSMKKVKFMTGTFYNLKKLKMFFRLWELENITSIYLTGRTTDSSHVMNGCVK